MNKKHLILGIVLIAVAACARLIPHPNNFSPVGSMALFGGAIFASKIWKYAIPIMALYFSDLLLNNTIHRMWYPQHEGIVLFSEYMVWGYASFILAVLIGHFLIKKPTALKVISGAIGFTAVFFLVSNFGTWASGIAGYPMTTEGLLACYGAGLPFVKSSLAGNLVYSIILFGGYELISTQLLSRKTAIA